MEWRPIVLIADVYPMSDHGSLMIATVKAKGKSVPLQARSGPDGSRKLRFPDYVKMAQNGGKVVSLTHRLHLSPGKSPGTHFY